MEKTLLEQLTELLNQAGALCGAIENLPASERQTALSLKASGISSDIQVWQTEEMAKGTPAQAEATSEKVDSANNEGGVTPFPPMATSP
jgi:hypothetical protein